MIVRVINVEFELGRFVFFGFLLLRPFLFEGGGDSFPEMVDFFNPGGVGIVHLSYKIGCKMS
jgi:hypothetical protein